MKGKYLCGLGLKYVGNNDCVVKTCPNMIMTHKTVVKVSHAVGVAFRDE